LDIKYKKIYMTVIIGKLENWCHTITALLSANLDKLVWKLPISSLYTQIKIHGYVKPNNVVGKTGYKWKTCTYLKSM
jgi:hypothetical protein